MSQQADQSVTCWIEALKNGDPQAVKKLWERYMDDLIRVAQGRLRRAPKGMADEEDAALSAFDSFCRGAARGRYPRLDDRRDLWRLLLVITERKVIDQSQRERRQKRGAGKILGMAELADADREDKGLTGVASPEPSPLIAAMVTEECQRLFGLLSTPTLRDVALMKMEGFTHDEIADRLGFSLRSVARKVDLIRKTWQGTIGGEP